MAGWNHNNTKWKPKVCLVCETVFTPRTGVHKFCSESCKGKWKYLCGKGSTETQYKKISGNWFKYFQRLCNQPQRKIDGITVEDLLNLLEKQQGKCALSGVTLTCLLEKGVICKTNASLDRVKAGGPYIKDNIQLVCRALNSWRSDIELSEFIWWCQQVAKVQEEKGVGFVCHG